MALRKPQKNVEAGESLIRNPSQKSFFLLLKIKKLQETYCFHYGNIYSQGKRHFATFVIVGAKLPFVYCTGFKKLVEDL